VPLFAHRENHGEGCGFTVKLKATDTNLEENVEVRELADWQLTKFANSYIESNCDLDSVIYLVVDPEHIVKLLSATTSEWLKGGKMYDLRLDAQNYFEENWDKFFPAVAEVA